MKTSNILLSVIVLLGLQELSGAAPHLRTPPKPALPVASRVPLPLRQVLYRKFMDAIQRADDVAEKKYPTPHSFVSNHAEFVRYMAIRSSYVKRLTDKYTAQVRHDYKVSTHEEDLIEEEGIAESWRS